MRKLVQKIACKTEKLAPLEKISTDGISSVSIFFHLWTFCVILSSAAHVMNVLSIVRSLERWSVVVMVSASYS